MSVMPAFPFPPPSSFRTRMLLYGLLLAAGTSVAVAQTTLSSRGESFIIDQWTVNNGLPQNTVSSIVQTSDGFLWLGTNGGLVRFDGVQFRTFEQMSPQDGRAYRVMSVVEGLDSTLWIGTEDGQLFRYRNEVFTPLIQRELHESHSPILSMGVDSSGLVWLGRAELGLARVVPRPGLADTVVQSALQPEWPYTGVSSVHASSDGTLWIGGSGVAQLMGAGIRTYILSNLSVVGKVTGMAQDEGTGLWAGTSDHRLYRRADSKFTEVPVHTLASEYAFDEALVANRADLRAAIRSGLLRFLGGRFYRYGTAQWERAVRVRQVLFDREGNIWIGTEADGLIRLRRATFEHWTLDGLRRSVTSMVADGKRGVWVGLNCGGVLLVRDGRVVPHPVSEMLAAQCVWSLAVDDRGDLWIGTWGGGLWRVNPDRPNTLHRFNRTPGLEGDVILALAPRKRGRGMWVGTNVNGLALITENAVQKWGMEEGLPSDDVRSFHEDSLGRLWIGTQRGPAVLEESAIRALDDGTGRMSVPIRVVHQGPRGSMWFGTYGSGLIRWRNGGASFITVSDGLYDNIVSQFMLDTQGYVWMGCNRGIWKVALSELHAFAEGRVGQVASISYGNQDGLVTIETNGGFQPSGLQLPNGEMWFPTPIGIARTNPRSLLPNRTKPPVVVSRLLVDGVATPVRSSMLIPSGVEEVRIEFTALSFTSPQKVRFKYQLVGYNKSWVDVHGERQATFTNVTPGAYRFRVIAANNDGVWNEEGAEISLTFELPYWDTIWFRALAILSLVGMGMLVVAIRLRQVRKEKERQEDTSRRLIRSQEEERQRIAGELHDSLGQDLIVAKNRLLLAAHHIDDHPQAKEELMNVVDAVTAALRSVRSIAYNLRPFQLDRLGLTETIRSTIRAVQQVTPIKIETEIATVDGLLNHDAEIGVFRIIQEALTNIVKHSKATRASVVVTYDEGSIVIRVEDNGQGFVTSDTGGVPAAFGFGLSSIEERVKMLGGLHKITSTPDGGTTVAARIPVASNEPEPEP